MEATRETDARVQATPEGQQPGLADGTLATPTTRRPWERRRDLPGEQRDRERRSLADDERRARALALGDVDGQRNTWPRLHRRRVFPDGSRLEWWRWQDGRVVGPAVAPPPRV